MLEIVTFAMENCIIQVNCTAILTAMVQQGYSDSMQTKRHNSELEQAQKTVPSQDF